MTRIASPNAAGGPLRRALRAACTLLCPLLIACGGGDKGSSTAPPVTPPDTSLALGLLAGADVSALGRIEQAGGVFRDGGQAGDATAILRAKGVNLFRLRLFVSPNGQDVQVNDLDYTLALARRVRAAGGTLLLDFHYSDTWADPGHQSTPAAWAGLDSLALEQRVEDYSADVITRLKAEGALPAIVQVGNEIDAGMLWPTGQLDSDTPAKWNRFTRLLKAAIRGVRRPLAPGDSVRIMLHYSQGGSASGTQWFFDRIASYAVPYEVIGLSYYPWWQGSLAALGDNLRATASRYDRDIIIVETSYPWRAGGWEDIATDRSTMTWPISPDGQTRFLRDVATTLAAAPGGHGRGLVWWYPEAIQVPGVFVWGGGSLSLFDASGNLLPAAALLGGTSAKR
jgi:arabinogalactan endo-1,4-beta-galactosidase